MGLLPISELLADARAHQYAVGAFNVVNLETVQAVLQAAQDERSPVIIQIWHGDLAHAGAAYMGAIGQIAAQASSVPVALQLDHGQSYAQALTCMDAGFSSVMIDLASSDFEENIACTRQVVTEAHARNISVEAELGEICDGQSSVEERKAGLTNPDLAAAFVRQTGVDALAISIGTAHGLYSDAPEIDFDRLQEILQAVDVPLVIHGGSNTPDQAMIDMVKLGIAKVNIGTDLMLAFLNGMQAGLDDERPDLAVRDVLGHARECVYQVTRQKIQLLHSVETDR